MCCATATLRVDSSPAVSALEALSQFAERFPKRVQAFLGAGDGFPELAGLDLDWLFAVSTVDGRIALEPSDRLRDFLAALGAVDADLLVVE